MMTSTAIEATFQEYQDLLGHTMVERAVSHAEDFDKLKARLLDPKRHINNIQGKDRVNAAGWQLIGCSLGVRVEILSKNSQGTPGAYREVLDGPNGKKIVSYSITVRASTKDGRLQESTGRCDSTETKHNQYEHKMEQVAATRARNDAICAIVGGEPGDTLDDPPPQKPEQRRQYPIGMLIELHEEKGKPLGSLGSWLLKNIPRFSEGRRQLTPEQSVIAYNKLSAL